MSNNMEKPMALLVEDETTLSMIIKDTLEDEGLKVVHACDGRKGLECFFKKKPDVIIADVMMPGMDGFEMVNIIRKSDKTIPIIFLTARSSLDDLANGFYLGANDYLRKPFKMLELVLRVKALINKAMKTKLKDEIYAIGNYLLNTTTQTLTLKDIIQNLSFMESELLKRLCINQNDVVEIESILNEVWNNDSYYNRSSLHVFIHKIRKRLSDDERIKIINVRGVGYKLIVQ